MLNKYQNKENKNTPVFFKKIVNGFIFGIGSLVVLYIYFVSTSTFDVVSRKNIENKVNTLESQVGLLELEYFKYDSAIDFSYAEKLGFVEHKNTTFSSRSISTALNYSTLDNNEIR